MLNLKIRIFLIHLNQRQKICDNPVFAVNLRCDITHEFLIQFFWNTLLSYQRICKNLHGSHRCFEFVGYIRYKLRSRLIQHLHSGKHLIKCIGDKFRLCIVRYADFILLISICQILDCLGDSRKWFDKNRGQNIGQKQ